GTYSPEALAEAEHFALTDYLAALTGAPPSELVARGLYAKVAALTGLSPEAVTRSRGFVRRDYLREVRGRDHKVVSA
ncbi:UNVERIFIED_CONTAM: carboxypeptidase, partial [Bacteroidetes bacterium 56_B9]